MSAPFLQGQYYLAEDTNPGMFPGLFLRFRPRLFSWLEAPSTRLSLPPGGGIKWPLNSCCAAADDRRAGRARGYKEAFAPILLTRVVESNQTKPTISSMLMSSKRPSLSLPQLLPCFLSVGHSTRPLFILPAPGPKLHGNSLKYLE